MQYRAWNIKSQLTMRYFTAWFYDLYCNYNKNIQNTWIFFVICSFSVLLRLQKIIQLDAYDRLDFWYAEAALRAWR